MGVVRQHVHRHAYRGGVCECGEREPSPRAARPKRDGAHNRFRFAPTVRFEAWAGLTEGGELLRGERDNGFSVREVILFDTEESALAEVGSIRGVRVAVEVMPLSMGTRRK